MAELTFADCKESWDSCPTSLEKVSFEIHELKTALLEKDGPTAVGNEFWDSKCFAVITDEEY